MTTELQKWFEAQVPGFSFSAAAAKTGIAVSSVRRHVSESKKTQSVHETVVAICRAYGLPVVEGLVHAGLISSGEAAGFAGATKLQDVSEAALLEEMLRRVKAGNASELVRPITAEDIESALDEDPDYSKMSDQGAYDLAANKGEANIGHDEIPNET